MYLTPGNRKRKNKMKTVVRKDYSQTKPHELPFIK
jgi:hypothetical protein